MRRLKRCVFPCPMDLVRRNRYWKRWTLLAPPPRWPWRGLGSSGLSLAGLCRLRWPRIGLPGHGIRTVPWPRSRREPRCWNKSPWNGWLTFSVFRRAAPVRLLAGQPWAISVAWLPPGMRFWLEPVGMSRPMVSSRRRNRLVWANAMARPNRDAYQCFLLVNHTERCRKEPRGYTQNRGYGTMIQYRGTGHG